MSAPELVRRLTECLAPPFYLCVFSEDQVSLDELSRLIINRGLQAIIGARKTPSFDNKVSYGLIYIREERCWSDCESKLGSEDNRDFPRCFYDCLNDTYVRVKNVLEGGEI